MKVFIGPVPVGNYFALLARSLREIGVEADYVLFFNHPLKFLEPDSRGIQKILLTIGKLRYHEKRVSLISKAIFAGLHELIRFIAFFYYFIRYDIFIFSFGESLLRNNWDLPLYHLFKKKAYFIFLGSDARPDYLDGYLTAGDRKKTIHDLIKSVAQKKSRLLRIEKYAEEIVNWPAQSTLMTRKFIHGLIVGFLSAKDENEALQKASLASPNPGKRVRILHAPTHSEAKGTPEIRNMIARLSKKHAFDWVEISGLPHKQVLEELRTCDFVVDQLYSDTPLAGLATEAAWFGKPAVVGGYWVRELSRDLPPASIPPSLYVLPEEMEEAIERLLIDADHRQLLGRKAQEFVTRHWNQKAIARRWLSILDGTMPADWFRDPMNIHFFHGCGLSEDRLRKSIRDVIENGGISAMQITDKPLLQQAITQFARDAHPQT